MMTAEEIPITMYSIRAIITGLIGEGNTKKISLNEPDEMKKLTGGESCQI